MKKWLIPIIIIALLAIWAYSAGGGFYNKTIGLQEDAKKQWSKVESSYQRRADLIPNLVATVKGYASHEKETLEGVIKARAEATKTTIDPSNMTPEKIAAFQKAQSGLAGALGKLMVVVEKYPDLKANQNFLQLSSQLEGTENRIKVERDRFNDVVSSYRKHIKAFPNNFFASWFGFEEMGYFNAEAGSEKVPKVNF